MVKYIDIQYKAVLNIPNRIPKAWIILLPLRGTIQYDNGSKIQFNGGSHQNSGQTHERRRVPLLHEEYQGIHIHQKDPIPVPRNGKVRGIIRLAPLHHTAFPHTHQGGPLQFLLPNPAEVHHSQCQGASRQTPHRLLTKRKQIHGSSFQLGNLSQIFPMGHRHKYKSISFQNDI